MAETADDITELLTVFADVQSKLALLPALAGISDADKLVRVNPTGNGYVVTTWDLATFGAADRLRAISVGTGLTGGGNLTADRTISLNFNALTTIGTADYDLNDRFPVYDNSATAHGKLSIQGLINHFGLVSTLSSLDAADTLLAWDDSAGTMKRLASTALTGRLTNLNLVSYTSSKTGSLGYTIPSNLISALVFCTGGGGGGGRAVASGTTYAAGGGGGSGATAVALYSKATLDAAVNASGKLDIQIGAGGLGATSASTTGRGGVGGFSRLGSGTGILAAAGGGGGATAAAGAFGIGGAAGVAPSTGTVKIPGAAGSHGQQLKVSSTLVGGTGAGSFWGGGSTITSLTTSGATVGGTGTGPGAGGGGAVAFTNATGANGGPGAAGSMVIIEVLG